MEWLKNNQEIFFGIMAFIIFFITNIIKMPIKHFTKKITNENIRKVLNSCILIFPFLLGLIGELIYSKYCRDNNFNLIKGISLGTASITFYAIIERFLGLKIMNPYKTKEGTIVLETIDKIAEDNILDKKDIDTVKNAIDKLNNAK